MPSKLALFNILLLLPLALAVPHPEKSDTTSDASPVSTTSSPTSTSDSSPTSTSDSSPSSTPTSGTDGNSTTGGDNGGSGGGNGTTGGENGGSSATGIDWTKWQLQLPAGSPGHPTTINGADMVDGKPSNPPDGFDKYFSMDGDTIILKVPGGPDETGCVTTENSKHCRTEFCEIDPKSWDPTATTNQLSATLLVTQADDSTYGTCIGQIHIQESVSVRPVCELYYNKNGDLNMGVEQTREGGNEKEVKVGNVPIGTKFSYVIAYEGGQLKVKINDGDFQMLDQYQLNNPMSYFKAGNYNQGTTPSEVHFFSIQTTHVA